MSENLSAEGGFPPASRSNPVNNLTIDVPSSPRQEDEPQQIVTNHGQDASDSEAEDLAKVHQMRDVMLISPEPLLSWTNRPSSDDLTVITDARPQGKTTQPGPRDIVQHNLSPREQTAYTSPTDSRASDLLGSSPDESSSGMSSLDLSSSDLPLSDSQSSDLDSLDFQALSSPRVNGIKVITVQPHSQPSADSSNSSSDLSSDDLETNNDSSLCPSTTSLHATHTTTAKDTQPPSILCARSDARCRPPKSSLKSTIRANIRGSATESSARVCIRGTTTESSTIVSIHGSAPENLVRATTRGATRSSHGHRSNKVSPVREADISCTLKETLSEPSSNSSKTDPVDVCLTRQGSIHGDLPQTRESHPSEPSVQVHDAQPIRKETSHPTAKACVWKSEKGGSLERRGCLRSTASERTAPRFGVRFAQYDRLRIYSTSIWLTVSNSYTGRSSVRMKQRQLTKSEMKARQQDIQSNMLDDWDGYEMVERDTWADGTPVSAQSVDQRYGWLMLNRPDNRGGFKKGHQRCEQDEEEQRPETVTKSEAVVQTEILAREGPVAVVSSEGATTRQPGKVRRVFRAVAGRLDVSWGNIRRCLSCTQGME